MSPRRCNPGILTGLIVHGRLFRPNRDTVADATGPPSETEAMSRFVSWRKRFFPPFLFFALLIVAAHPVQADDEAGTWEGTANQPGAGTFSVIMRLDGNGGGTTEYPSLSCSGVL